MLFRKEISINTIIFITLNKDEKKNTKIKCWKKNHVSLLFLLCFFFFKHSTQFPFAIEMKTKDMFYCFHVDVPCLFNFVLKPYHCLFICFWIFFFGWQLKLMLGNSLRILKWSCVRCDRLLNWLKSRWMEQKKVRLKEIN